MLPAEAEEGLVVNLSLLNLAVKASIPSVEGQQHLSVKTVFLFTTKRVLLTN